MKRKRPFRVGDLVERVVVTNEAPVAQNSTEDGRAKNRRVDLVARP